MNRLIQLFTLISFFVVGVVCAQECRQKRRVFRNNSGSPVIAMVKTCDSPENRYTDRDYTTSEIADGSAAVLDVKDPLTREIRFAYTTINKPHVTHICNPRHEEGCVCEYILKPEGDCGKIYVYEDGKRVLKK